jgi:hypothetical protein
MEKQKYPTMDQLDQADRITVCRMYRFLPSPTNREEEAILAKVAERFRKLGGMTPAISKQIGWEP